MYKLDINREKHINSVVSLMRCIIGGMSDDFKWRAIDIAQYHDIGYAKELCEVGFHPIDSYLYLKKLGFDESVCKVVLMHTNAKELCPKNLLNYYDNIVLNEEELLLYDYITYCDTRVNHLGEYCSVEERYNNILNRYGEDHIATKVFKINKKGYMSLDKSIEGVKEWV